MPRDEGYWIEYKTCKVEARYIPPREGQEQYGHYQLYIDDVKVEGVTDGIDTHWIVLQGMQLIDQRNH